MHLRTLLSGTLALLLLSGAAVSAESAGFLNPFKTTAEGLSVPLPKFDLPKLFKSAAPAPVQLAQAVGDPRITALEEQVRALSGTVEELNFQILQMQEQLRKIQEDNEFRFQELEKKKSDAGAKPNQTVAEAPAPATDPAKPGTGATASVPAPEVKDVIIENGGGDPAALPGVETGSTKTFGTITFDDKGNVTGGSVGDQMTAAPADVASPPAAAADKQPDGTVVAALPATDDPEELYRNSYEFILSGDYGTAESGFRDHIARFPADPKTADARFWLGEAQLGQKKYRDAAETFLAANKEFPSSKKAPDMLLKLGVALVGLDQRDVACATFAEIGKRYPAAGGVLKDRVKQEQALAAC